MAFWKPISKHTRIKDRNQKSWKTVLTKRKIQDMKFVGRDINCIMVVLLRQVGPDGMYLFNTQYGNIDDEDEDEEMDDEDEDNDDNDEDDDDDDNQNHFL